MKKLTGFVLVLSLFASLSLLGQKALYQFCVSSSDFNTFKAAVVFKSIDFGEVAARQMVYNKVQSHLGSSVKVQSFSAACACADTCALLEVSATDWDGHLSEVGLSTSSILGASAEVLDKVFSQGQRLLTNPGGFVKDFLNKSEYVDIRAGKARKALFVPRFRNNYSPKTKCLNL
jgi:hypothetical protein